MDAEIVGPLADATRLLPDLALDSTLPDSIVTILVEDRASAYELEP